MTASTMQQAGRFAAIGAIGFVVDGGILTLLHSAYDVDLVYARLVSFSVAVTLTWFLNRRHTFTAIRNDRAGREWSRYAAVNGTGALLNLGIFLWLIYAFAPFARWPIVPLAIAASIALLFNFFGSRRIAFRQGES
jgi:putative flippase GtrA